MNQNKKNKDIDQMSFEEALEELDAITENFEDGNPTLESSVNIYERAISLKEHCEKKLSIAKKKIDEIKIINKKKDISEDK